MSLDLQTSFLVSLAYKLIDQFPKLSLFGGFVRDYAIPKLMAGTPCRLFSRCSQEPEDRLNDVDFLLELTPQELSELRKNPDFNFADSWVRNELVHSGLLRNWDWFVEDTVPLNVYGAIGVRLILRHVCANILTHIDVMQNHNVGMDLDVNDFAFSKKLGLYRLSDRHIEHYTISKRVSRFVSTQRLLDAVKNKQGVFTLSPEEENRQGVDKVASIAHRLNRFEKYIRKGWTIRNATPFVRFEAVSGSEFSCPVCDHDMPFTATFTESKQQMCYDCFFSRARTELSEKGFMEDFGTPFFLWGNECNLNALVDKNEHKRDQFGKLCQTISKIAKAEEKVVDKDALREVSLRCGMRGVLMSDPIPNFSRSQNESEQLEPYIDSDSLLVNPKLFHRAYNELVQLKDSDDVPVVEANDDDYDQV